MVAAINKVDVTQTTHIGGADRQTVLREDARAMFFQAMRGSDTAKRKAWSRACSTAIKSGVVKAWQDQLYVPGGNGSAAGL